MEGEGRESIKKSSFAVLLLLSVFHSFSEMVLVQGWRLVPDWPVVHPWLWRDRPTLEGECHVGVLHVGYY